ncbi:SMI1/KNR4 family protein [Microbacterium koreense]|uniref:SMI1/KNR4 family protein n=1 Tax=Microbacterium koreense TaxID=323761 RepID=A0ABW2ZSZ7_9MICO
MTEHKWHRRITALVRQKEQIARLDKDRLFPYTLPAVGATEDQLDALESVIGMGLGEEHRSFLATANGWRAFFETQDLLSTDQLAGGPHRSAFTTWIDSAPPQARDAGFTSANVLPIAVDLEMPLFSAMPITEGRVLGRVIVLDPSGVIDDFESFASYIDSTITYTQRNLEDFEAGRYQA